MFAEDYIVFHVDDVHGVVRVVFLQELEDFQFNACLEIVLLLVFYDLNSDIFLGLVVKTFDSYSKGPPAQMLNNFIPVREVILHQNSVVPFRIIVTAVRIFFLVNTIRSVLGGLSVAVLRLVLMNGRLRGLNFLHPLSKVEDLRKVEYLGLFILSKMSCSKKF